MSSRRVALVTGAARGIGLATARELLRTGYSVAMLDTEDVSLSTLIDPEYLEFARFGAADVRHTASVSDFIRTVTEELGPVTVLVNNAGISPKVNGKSRGILEVTDDEWEDVMDVNVRSILKLCQLCIPTMRSEGFGRIVNVASMAGRTKSVVAGPSYSASKAAVIGLSRAIAVEMGPYGITSNCVAPGRVLTEMAQQAGDEVNKTYATTIPVRRLGTPEEVGSAISFLCQESSGFINGAVIDINGGFFMS